MKKNSMTMMTPSEKNVENLVRDITHAKAELDQLVVQLTSIQKKHSPRSRRGWESTGELMARLGQEWKVVVPGTEPSEIIAQRAMVTRLRPLQSAATELARSVNSAVFAAQSKAWATTTDVYSVLTTMAKRNETLKGQLAPATEFFARGKRKPKTPLTPPAK